MALLPPPPPRVLRPERIDSVEPSDSDFAASFRDIARVNRYLGGTRAVLRALAPLTRDLSSAAPAAPIRILDIATGSADIPRAIQRAWQRGALGARPLQITATDNHPKVLALARRLTQGYPRIAIEAADALALPYADGAFDIALCSMAFHHLGESGCLQALQEMERVASAGFVVNDLVRDRTACALIWLLTRLVGANRLTRHDAPLSVLRAFTLAEYAAMTCAAGIPNCEVRSVPLYRAVIVRRRSGGER